MWFICIFVCFLVEEKCVIALFLYLCLYLWEVERSGGDVRILSPTYHKAEVARCPDQCAACSRHCRVAFTGPEFGLFVKWTFYQRGVGFV